MKRGELSFQSAPVCAVDWRVLLQSSVGEGWLGKLAIQALAQSNMEAFMRRSLRFREGARGWLERVDRARILVFSVGLPEAAPAIDLVLADRVSETEHFGTRDDFRVWMKRNPQVYRAFTDDSDLVTLDGTVRRFGGWSERLD